MSVGGNIKKTDPGNGAIEQFNAIVMAALPSRGGAAFGSETVYPNGPLGGQNTDLNEMLGPRAEPDMTVADLYSNAASEPGIAGSLISMALYHALHQFAIKATRVRLARMVLFTGPGGGPFRTVVGLAFVAFKPGLGRVFEISSMPWQQINFATPSLTDNVMTQASFTAFLVELRNRVIAIRNDANLANMSVLHYCHGSCHASCHGARARR